MTLPFVKAKFYFVSYYKGFIPIALEKLYYAINRSDLLTPIVMYNSQPHHSPFHLFPKLNEFFSFVNMLNIFPKGFIASHIVPLPSFVLPSLIAMAYRITYYSVYIIYPAAHPF